MRGAITRVREIPDVGFEVVRDSATRGRYAIGFRLHAEEANDLARESYELERCFHLLNPTAPGPVLELWEPEA